MTTIDIRLPRNEIISILSERDGYFCFLCNEDFEEGQEPTLDHWIPQARGGGWEIENLRLAHKRCNALKGDRMPNPDGTLPEIRRVSRAVKKVRPTICETCNAGRNLGPEEICEVCGSLPQPYTFPRWAQMRPKECSHSGPWHCWMCTLGFIERTPAIVDVLDGEYLN